jgi:hypothetical protein
MIALQGVKLCGQVPLRYRLPFAEPILYLFLANAAEGMGDRERMVEYDQMAVTKWMSQPDDPYLHFIDKITCYDRRKGMVFFENGDLEGAARTLAYAEALYIKIIDKMEGINLRSIDYRLLPVIEACKVYVEVLYAKGDDEHARTVEMDLQETEATLEGYRKGVLEEPRRQEIQGGR